MNRKIVVASVVGALAIGFFGASAYINSKAEERIKESFGNRQMEYSRISCNILFGNSCSVYDVYADNKKNEKAKKVTLSGLREMIFFDKDKDSLTGKHKFSINVEGITDGSGKSFFNGITQDEARRVLGEEGEKLLKNDISLLLDIEADFQKDKILLETSAKFGIEKFPLSTSVNLAGYCEGGLDTLKKELSKGATSIFGVTKMVVPQKAILTINQENSFASQIMRNFYLEKSKNVNLKTPQDWKIFNQGFFGESSSKFKITEKDSALSVSDFRELGLLFFTDKNNSERKNFLRNNPVRNIVGEKDIDVIAKKVFGKDETLSLSITNLRNLPLSSVAEIFVKNQNGAISDSAFANAFKIEIK